MDAKEMKELARLIALEMQTDECMKELARLIALEMQKPIITETDISALCNKARGSVTIRELLKKDGFPQPFRFTENGFRHWLKKDVVRYLEDMAHQDSRAALSTISF